MKYLMFILLLTVTALMATEQAEIWDLYESGFVSEKDYENPLYDVNLFKIEFTSQSGRVQTINGFWDGGSSWKVRFCPDELGTWTFQSSCSDENNSGLHSVSGSFECVENSSELDIYQRGAIKRPPGEYHLTYADGTPFFFVACTAWNGALRSNDEEWDYYLQHRVDHHYNTIQFVTTQWRGCEADREGQVAFTGSGRIELNVDFFKRMDSKIQRINDHGLVAAPVLLWALPFGAGRHLSPGYYLPHNEAILLARYMVARFGGYHVIWILGGDGRYVDEYEQRWKNIGRGVFGDDPPGIVAQHPHGRSWIGDAYADEAWLDIVGYQSSHSNKQRTVDWINKGPMSQQWDKLQARPIINMEPNYEEIRFMITAKDVRNASYWSLLATPMAGITYGANGIWPWLYEGEKILNHNDPGGVTSWEKSLDFPGSLQIGYLSEFFQNLEWWRYKPAPERLAEQPGDEHFDHFISLATTETDDSMLAYVPVQSTIKILNPYNYSYAGSWFDPVKNTLIPATLQQEGGLLQATSPGNSDFILLLSKIDVM